MHGGHHGVGIAAVSVLRAQGPDDAVLAAGRSRARRPDGNGRRVRRQGRVPVAHCRARRVAGDEIGPARQARVRPRRGHGGHDQAAPVTDAAPYRPVARRAARGDGHRFRPGRRRVLHVVASRPFARNAARGWPLLLPQRSHSRPRDGHVDAAAWGISGVRRAAEPVRARAAHGRGGGARTGSRPTISAAATSSSRAR